MDLIIEGGLYKPPSISDEPDVCLSRCSIYKIQSNNDPNSYSFHFVGKNNRYGDGRVSSRIVNFDSETMTGVTSSGRTYKIISTGGMCMDAEYVFNQWLHINSIQQSQVSDFTEEFLKIHGEKSCTTNEESQRTQGPVA